MGPEGDAMGEENVNAGKKVGFGECDTGRGTSHTKFIWNRRACFNVVADIRSSTERNLYAYGRENRA
jgi:hypothetical protein